MRVMIAGADGCKAGWLVSMSEDWPCSKAPLLYMCRDFRGLLELTRRCEVAVVDIPIGLPSGRERRICDFQAREMLGREGQDRVFLAPPREALMARSPEDFQTMHRRLLGKGAGIPVWGLVPKLREVDEAMTPDKQNQVREFHPELAWHRLAGRTLASKHKKEGVNARVEILRKFFVGIDSALDWSLRLGRAGAVDDLLDAIVGLSVAESIRSGSDGRFRLPAGQPATDARGLRMEIWF